jgi:hypothetical protein
MHVHQQLQAIVQAQRAEYRAFMAATSKITIHVKASRGASTVSYSTTGRYISFPTTGYVVSLPGQPIQPTSSLKAFWTSVLAIVQAEIAAAG